jgi:hypothetical protein
MVSPTKTKKRVTLTPDAEVSIDGEEPKTDDIYEVEQRDEMLEDDEITAAEDGFMRGRDMAMKEMEGERKKGSKPIIHDDGTSVNLNEEQYEED